jgi:UDP-2,3-diacylglucosamine pyrophosphatase LpxH
VRTAWISDVHLGTRGSGAARLLDFLREYDFERLYIVGDLIDIWQMRRSRYWPQQHNDVIQKILRKSRKGTRVVYIPGNHDEMISSFYGVVRRNHDPEPCHPSYCRWHLVRDFAIMVRQRRLRPEKGRRKDLRKIESLISDLRPLVDDE